MLMPTADFFRTYDRLLCGTVRLKQQRSPRASVGDFIFCLVCRFVNDVRLKNKSQSKEFSQTLMQP